MKRVLIMSFVAIMAFAISTAAQEREKAPNVQPREIPVTITNAEGRAIRADNLTRPDQARLERMKQAARTLVSTEPGGPQAIKISISCTYPPLRCTIIISF